MTTTSKTLGLRPSPNRRFSRLRRGTTPTRLQCSTRFSFRRPPPPRRRLRRRCRCRQCQCSAPLTLLHRLLLKALKRTTLSFTTTTTTTRRGTVPPATPQVPACERITRGALVTCPRNLPPRSSSRKHRGTTEFGLRLLPRGRVPHLLLPSLH